MSVKGKVGEGFNAEEDARVIKVAMNGKGTGEKQIISLLCKRNSEQRAAIEVAYNKLFQRNLTADLKSELSACYEEALLALMTPSLVYLTNELKRAITSKVLDEGTLIEIICTRDAVNIEELKHEYHKRFNVALAEAVHKHSSGGFQSVMDIILNFTTPPKKLSVTGKAANLLHKIGFSTSDGLQDLLRALFFRGNKDLLALFDEFEKAAGSSIEAAIQTQLLGRVKEVILTIVKSRRSPAVYFCERLKKSIDKTSRDEHSLVRILFTRGQVELEEITKKFCELYGKPLDKTMVEEDLSFLGVSFPVYSILGISI